MKFGWQAIMTENMRRRAGRLAASALFLATCSSCAVNRPLAQSEDPFLAAPSRGVEELARVPRAAGGLNSGEFRYGERSSRSSQPARSLSRVSHAGFETQSEAAPGRVDAAIERTSAEPRVPAVFECPVVDESPAALAKIYPDEYLFDGGDRDLPIHFEQMQMAGLDSSDAAIEYRDVQGNVRVTPTNRVAVYSPRFASVVSVSQPIEGVGGGRPVQSWVRISQGGLDNRSASFAHHQRDMAERMLSRSRGSGLKTSDAAAAVDAPLSPMGHVHTAVPVADFAFVRTGVFKQADEPWLAASIESAEVWTRDQNPIIVVKSDRALELRGWFAGQEMVGQENRFNGSERLRIVKLADKSIAAPGEVVTFTIRFDNIGDRPVSDVRIIDNLTPRLEYVDDSATSTLDGRLVVEDNGEGSLILRWELDDELAARSGGVVTFRALVR